MDLRVEEERGRRAGLTVELSEEAGEFKNNADVNADVYYVPAATSQSGMRQLATFNLIKQRRVATNTHFRSRKPASIWCVLPAAATWPRSGW